jgi:homoserine dehydrogenase
VLVDLLLVGFGHVGRRFARLLEERRAALARTEALEPRVVGVATRRHGAALAPAGLDLKEALARVEAGRRLEDLHDETTGPAPMSGLDLIHRCAQGRGGEAPWVVVETTWLDVQTGGPAVAHVRAALASGAHVVTANKGPVAVAYRELRALAEARDRAFLFEGAVMDGVPVFNLVRETLPGVEIRGFRGVINATTNYILTALEEGQPFERALADMQAAGIAEADPSLDLDGWDAAAKTAALANVWLDADLTPARIARAGIAPATAAEARAALAGGERLRLVARAARRGPTVEAEVALIRLPADDLLAGLRGLANALVIETDLLGEVAIVQMGGGLTQTAYALLSDLVAVTRRLRAPGRAPRGQSP